MLIDVENRQMIRALVSELVDITDYVNDIHKALKEKDLDPMKEAALYMKEHRFCMEAVSVMDQIMDLFVKVKRFEKNSEKTKIFVKCIKKQVENIVGGL